MFLQIKLQYTYRTPDLFAATAHPFRGRPIAGGYHRNTVLAVAAVNFGALNFYAD